MKVLDGVSLSLEKSKTYAFVGHSGCGKSSTISLMERFYDPQVGKICYDGKDIKEIDNRWLKKQIGIVSQEPILFSGSIRQNVTYGLESWEYTEKDIVNALKSANAFKFIMDKKKFPQGVETIVGERGVRLSGG